MQILRADQRGVTDIGWLDSRHSFAFGRAWPDGPHARGYRTLRVLNDDRVAPGGGFDEHPHEDMEIVSIVLSGALAHRDSTGAGSTITRGDVQRMTAGSGIRHSEFNASETEPVHFLQLWIRPERTGLEPGYEQKRFDFDERPGELHLIASRGADDGSLHIHQDARLLLGRFDADQRAGIDIDNDRGAWVHIAQGTAAINTERLTAGDGVAIDDPGTIEIASEDDGSLVLVFDLA